MYFLTSKVPFPELLILLIMHARLWFKFFRFDLDLPHYLQGLLIKLSSLVLSIGRKTLLITCNLFWTSFSQKMLLILLLILEIDHHNYLMLARCSIELIHYHPFLILMSHPYILNGGMLCGFCNGITLRG